MGTAMANRRGVDPHILKQTNTAGWTLWLFIIYIIIFVLIIINYRVNQVSLYLIRRYLTVLDMPNFPNTVKEPQNTWIWIIYEIE